MPKTNPAQPPKEDLIRLFMAQGLTPEESANAANPVEGFADDREPYAPSVSELMRRMESEYAGWIGRPHTGPRHEAVEEIAAQLSVAEDVAEEVLQDLEADHQPDLSATPDHQREKQRRLLRRLGG